MSVTSKASSDGKSVEIAIRGRFDFSVQQQFRDAYRDHDKPGLKFIVNLAEVEYMDSAALGMLMVLKKYADKMSGGVVLKRPPQAIKRILLTAKFDKLFTIEE